MQSLTIFNTRDIKRIREILLRQFGVALDNGYAYLKNSKERIFIVSKDAAKLNLKNLIIDRLGLYFAEDKGSELRLSKEGAFLLGIEAQKQKKTLHNVVSLTKEEVKIYFTGADLQKELGEQSKLVLLQYDEEIIGCSKYKEGKILNYLPKIHRGEVIL